MSEEQNENKIFDDVHDEADSYPFSDMRGAKDYLLACFMDGQYRYGDRKLDAHLVYKQMKKAAKKRATAAPK